MEKKGSYVGKVKNSGVQVVKAPLGGGAKKGSTVKKTGSDLRDGKK